MARSEAQKAADKRYREKTQDQYEHFVVNLKREECASICAAIKAAGMGKAEFLRWAVGELEKGKTIRIAEFGRVAFG